jgi:hypothetical protein
MVLEVKYLQFSTLKKMQTQGAFLSSLEKEGE